jgi:anti-sigma B factor antagonist
MNLIQKDMGDVTILQVEGMISGEEGEDLRDRIRNLVAAARTKVVLDLARVSWINSSGLGTLHHCLGDIREAGGSFKLTNVNPRVRQVLSVSRFDTIFESYSDVRGALASFYR